MNRHRSYFPQDEAPVPSGDSAFVGVDARRDPGSLEPGLVSSAVNLRFDSGRAETRRGVRILPWASMGTIGPGLVNPFGAVLAAAVFAHPLTGVQWVILVTANGTYKARQGQAASVVPAPVDTDLSVVTDLFQAYDGMILLRGADADPLYLDDLVEGWKPLPSPDVGKVAMPRAYRGLYVGNRAVVVDARQDLARVDSLWVSDIGGVSSVLQGDESYQNFRINQGSSDRLVGVAKFSDSSLVVGKGQSVYVISNVYGTNDEIAQQARLDEITRAYGCLAPHTFVQVGKDLWFLGHRRGVCSIAQTATNALQGVDVPVSRDIQPIVDRINWPYAHLAVAAVHDNRVYFAVPLDSATDNSAVLVYSTLSGRWAGYDTGSAIRVRSWLQLTVDGISRLAFVSTLGYVCLYEDGFRDQVGGLSGAIDSEPIETHVLTRGYGAETPGIKRFSRLSFRAAGEWPSFSVSVEPDGIGEGLTQLVRAWDRTKYRRPYGTPDWTPDNSNLDWDTPHRQDYSVDVDGLVPTDGDGEGVVAWDRLQQTEDGARLLVHGEYLQVRVANLQGRLELASVTIEATRGKTRDGEET